MILFTLQYFGIEADSEAEGVNVGDILDERALRQGSVFAILSAVFAASASGEKDATGFWQKSLHYQKLFHNARVKARVGIDSDGDNTIEELRIGETVRLRRL